MGSFGCASASAFAYMFSGACMLVCNKRKIVQMMMAPYCLKRKLMKRMRSKAHVSGQNTHPTEPHHTKHHQQLSGHKRMDCLVRHLCDALLVLHSEHQEIEMLLWFSFLLGMLLRAMNYFRGIVVVLGFLLSKSVP